MLPRRPAVSSSVDAAKAEAPAGSDRRNGHKILSGEVCQAELRSNIKYPTDHRPRDGSPQLDRASLSTLRAIRNRAFECALEPWTIAILDARPATGRILSPVPGTGYHGRVVSRQWCGSRRGPRFGVQQTGRPGQIPGKTQGNNYFVGAPERNGSSGKSDDHTMGRRDNSCCASQGRRAVRFGRVSKNPHGAYENDFR